MFEATTMMPNDPLLGLMQAFAQDTSREKVDLGIGVYKNDQGHVPIMASVKKAEAFLLATQQSKNYTGSLGDTGFVHAIEQLAWGEAHEVLVAGRIVSVQSIGGTGGLRVAADLVRNHNPGATIWIGNPTWTNHPHIFQSAGLTVRNYPCYDPGTRLVPLPEMFEALRDAKAGDVVLLHACCHNPTGVDPDEAQWRQIAEYLAERQLIPLVDMAYQGFGVSLKQDRHGLLTLQAYCPELLLVTSCSKTFGLYNERVGVLSIVTGTQEQTKPLLSQMMRTIRGNYSIPAAHGAQIVGTVLTSTELKLQWQQELEEARQRIVAMRRALVMGLKTVGAEGDFSFLLDQNGMFSWTGLTRDQVRALQQQWSIYMPDDGRINMAGLSERNMGYVCLALKHVLAGHK